MFKFDLSEFLSPRCQNWLFVELINKPLSRGKKSASMNTVSILFTSTVLCEKLSSVLKPIDFWPPLDWLSLSRMLLLQRGMKILSLCVTK